MKEMGQQKFTEDEWKACIKVLSILKDDPLQNPDNQTFKTLIKKIYKEARREIRKQNSFEYKNEDTVSLQESFIVRNALNNTTDYSTKDITYQDKFSPLHAGIGCYCCGTTFNQRHFFYSRLCPECAEKNYNNRFLSTDLSGRNVILTGGRVKIGYATCLKLLSAGANLIVTTRFPGLLLQTLSQEKDFPNWKDRLIVYGLDLRNLQAVEEFIHFVKFRFNSLDILINNAAQTIKYTDEYYIPLVQNEQQAIKLVNDNSHLMIENKTGVGSLDPKLLDIGNQHLIPEINRFGQPVDKREKNSWNSTLEEISLHELLEVNLINQISPYLLVKGFKHLMEQSNYPDRFVINVTSSEGQFSYTNKTVYHPHTNMTKAALNMLTRTSAEEFARNHIYMNSVDVGWISTGAVEPLRKKQFLKGYVPPLDSVDGASRILEPIIRVIENKEEPVWGKLLKNYTVVNW